MTEEHVPSVTSTPPPIEKLAAALSKAQAELKNPPKNKTAKIRMKEGGSYTYHYADLADILDCVRETLAKNGLAVTQIVTRNAEGNVLLSRLLHVSGQYVESVYPLPQGCGAQEMGSAITYARRYSICPLLGIAGETDEDAQQAQDASESADDEKKRLALDRLEAAKKEGRLKSAYDGHVLKPGEPEPKPETAKPEVGGQRSKVGGQKTDASDRAIDPRLAELLKRDGITIEQLKAFAVKGKYITPEMDMSKLHESFIKACLNPVNWKKVVASTKGAK